MAEKFSVLIKYKYLDYIDSAKLSDADAWAFLKGIIEYDKTGTEPIYSNPVLSGLFAVVKIDLDKNKESYDAVSQARSDAGKEGAKKRWGKGENNKDSKSHDDIAKMANANGNGNCYDSQKNIAKMPDLDLGIDLGFVNDDDKESAVVQNSLPSPFSDFQTTDPPEKQTFSPGMFCGNPASVWETIRNAWNSHNCRFTFDKLYMNLSYDQKERVRGTMATYTPEQMVKAIDKYFKERKEKPGGYEYKSFYLFVEKGMEFYVE